jgi:BolA protein
MSIQQVIEKKLMDAFEPVFLEVEDESHMHNVAPGAQSHFKVSIATPQFDGVMLIKRHRLVNKVLKAELERIHALALHTLTPEEWFEKGGKVADSPLCEGGGKNQ